MGYEVIDTVVNGKDAIKRTGDTNPDLVLMDIQLNGEMDGIQVAKQIHNRYNIPFIYLSGIQNNKILEKIETNKHFGYITKPFDDIEIQNTIEMAITKK